MRWFVFHRLDKKDSRTPVHGSYLVKDACVFFALERCCAFPFGILKSFKTYIGSVRCDSYFSTKGDSMAEASSELEGPDFEYESNINDIADGAMLLGHAFGEPVLVARQGDD